MNKQVSVRTSRAEYTILQHRRHIQNQRRKLTMLGALIVDMEGTAVGAETPAGAVTGATTGSMDARGLSAGAACAATQTSDQEEMLLLTG